MAVAQLFATPFAARAQGVGIGTTTPDAKAALDVTATDKGLLVYQTDGTASGGSQSGFWYFAGNPAAWTFLNPTGAADNLGNHAATQALNLAGNALTGTGASIGTAVGLGVRADGGLNLGQNTTGNNVYLGFQAGQANTTGSNNQFVGLRSGQANTTGRENYFSGYESGWNNTTGLTNQFDCFRSGYANTAGSFNYFSGGYSGYANTTGNLTNAGAIGYNAQVSQSNALALGGTGASVPAARLHVYAAESPGRGARPEQRRLRQRRPRPVVRPPGRALRVAPGLPALD